MGVLMVSGPRNRWKCGYRCVEDVLGGCSVDLTGRCVEDVGFEKGDVVGSMSMYVKLSLV
jgi:hypothetical protein